MFIVEAEVRADKLVSDDVTRKELRGRGATPAAGAFYRPDAVAQLHPADVPSW